jgi:putative ABC transport system substrate-binding protein
MRRRDFVKAIGAAAAWPFVARAQQSNRMRRIGLLMGFDQGDLRSAQAAAFREGLQNLGWIDGQNIVIDTRWVPNIADAPAIAAELLALSPEVVFASPHYAAAALYQLTRTIPIVATISGDPVRAGFVQNYARPGGNITVFQLFEATINAKYPQLLRDIAPHVNRAAVVHGENTSWRQDFATIKTAASSVKLDVVEIIVRDAVDIEQKIGDFARTPNGGLILPPDSITIRHRKSVVETAANNRLPALYTYREFVSDGV